MTDLWSAVLIFFIAVGLSLLQLTECGPRFWHIPDPSLGVECPRTPNFGEYCDKFGSGRIKECSPCSIEQLKDQRISHPEDCANVPCPYRCPEEISDRSASAPFNSCDVTTASPTTLDLTTEAPSTTTKGTSTQTTVSGITTSVSSTTQSPTDDSPSSPRSIHVILWPILVFAVLFTVICAVICVRKCKKNHIVTSPSNEPMIAEINIEMTPPHTPLSPEFVPGPSSVTIRSTEPDLFAKLDCACGDAAVPVGPSGAILPDLLPSTRYGITVGTQDHEGFHQKYHEMIKTADTVNDVEGCTFTLQDLKTHIENNSQDFQTLRVTFNHVEDAAFRRAMSRLLRVASLHNEIGLSFLEDIITIDSERRAGNSLKLHVILSELIGCHSTVPDFVEEIVQKISSIHEDCLPCRHLVCQISKNSLVTTV
ncbi:uncharacterized protein LOC121409837 [Lytechinus variegatus]|uniref:uncharacterized protein LOC121409837 n=1 Tax=Lytechinus variegatus TaxID=7654 RepID=UPI001BB18FEA|nr:uncharacterized protein LOC121409837 [Lytechinus variegatus]